MTRFEESALRNSAAGEQNPSTLPYWHPSSQFSSLIDPQTDAQQPVGQQVGALNGQNVGYQGFSEDPMSVSSYSQFSDFSNLAQELSRDLTGTDQSTPMSQYASSVSVKTPTGGRTMRRPGLAGAPALVNGQYCCHWSINGIACRHKFMDAKSLNDHIRSHHVRGAGSFVCQWSGCDKGAFPTANKLVRHVHSHTGYKPFPCPNCTQAFVTKDQLDKHLTTHTGAKDFVCDWPGCGRSFAVKHALDGHMNSVHLKSKKHICPHCTQAFDDSSNLSKHKKQVHNPETGIKCPARHSHGCTYVDSRKDKMKEHCERERHGLETATDPHAWNLWVQQFKTASKKACNRRHCHARHLSDMSMSRASSTSSGFVPPPIRAPMGCSKQDCNMPVCLPCNILCNNDLFPAHDAFQPCEQPCDTETCGTQPCDEADCGPCEEDLCNDPECDLTSREPCNIQPCDIMHNPCTVEHESCVIPHESCALPNCRSITSTPTQPPTPHHSTGGGGSSREAYFSYHSLAVGEHDPFQDAEHPFQLNHAQLHDQLNSYMSMNY